MRIQLEMSICRPSCLSFENLGKSFLIIKQLFNITNGSQPEQQQKPEGAAGIRRRRSVSRRRWIKIVSRIRRRGLRLRSWWVNWRRLSPLVENRKKTPRSQRWWKTIMGRGLSHQKTVSLDERRNAEIDRRHQWKVLTPKNASDAQNLWSSGW